MKMLAVVQILSGDTKIEFCSKGNAISSTRECSCGVLMKNLAVYRFSPEAPKLNSVEEMQYLVQENARAEP